MTRTLRPDCASAAATLTVVVVLPTPPFWLATVSTRVDGRSGEPAPSQGETPARVLGQRLGKRGVSARFGDVAHQFLPHIRGCFT